MTRVGLVGGPALWQSDRGPGHPLRAERLERTWDLLHAYDAFHAESVTIAPRPAAVEELTRFHDPAYVDAVRQLSAEDDWRLAEQFGFAPGDNPVTPGMYALERLRTGATLVAAEKVVSGELDVAFAFAGGMHHAKPARPWGFCVFNDPVVAIHWLLAQGLRVVYVDIDAHHGDGVQDAFYDTDQVMTISLHESGRFLFPGTGFANEMGRGPGAGYAVNIPLPPYTGDAEYVQVFREIVPPLVRHFAPDVLVSQLGADAHYMDPLSHLQLTTEGYCQVIETISELCPRWVALGGGGYEMSVVPRVWTLAYGIMSGQTFPDALPATYARMYEHGALRDDVWLDLEPTMQQAVALRVRNLIAELREHYRI